MDGHLQTAAIRREGSPGDLPMRAVVCAACACRYRCSHRSRCSEGAGFNLRTTVGYCDRTTTNVMAAVSREPAADRHRCLVSATGAQGDVDVGIPAGPSSRLPRLSTGRGTVGARLEKLIALDFQTGAVRWRYKNGRDWRVVARCGKWRRLRGRSDGNVSRRRRENRQGAVDVQNDGRDSIRRRWWWATGC